MAAAPPRRRRNRSGARDAGALLSRRVAAIGAQDVLDEASTLHRSARHLIADVVDMAPLDPLLDATVKSLGERVDRHKREEDVRLLPRLRTADLDLGALGARIAERKGEFLAEMEGAED